MGAEEAISNLILLMNFEFQQFTVVIHLASKVQSVIEMASKMLFLPQINENYPAAADSAPPGSLCDTLELQQFVQHGA